MLDPACGSGNFLYLALHALKDLEHRVRVEAQTLGLQPPFPAVGPANVKGIELNPYAAELARVSVWIGEIQWMRRHGFREDRDPILKPLDTIECRDAVLTLDGREPEWPEADVVIGNPPFLGDSPNAGCLGTIRDKDLRKAYRFGSGDCRPGLLLVRQSRRSGRWKARSHAPDWSPPTPSAAGATATCWTASLSEARFTTLGRTNRGWWTARPCACRWSASAARMATAIYLDGEAVEAHQRGPDRGPATASISRRRTPRRTGVAFMGDTKGVRSIFRAIWPASGCGCRQPERTAERRRPEALGQRDGPDPTSVREVDRRLRMDDERATRRCTKRRSPG